MANLILHIKVPDIYADDYEELLEDYYSGPGLSLIDLIEDEINPDVGVTIVTKPGDKCTNDEFTVVALNGQIVGADLES